LQSLCLSACYFSGTLHHSSPGFWVSLLCVSLSLQIFLLHYSARSLECLLTLTLSLLSSSLHSACILLTFPLHCLVFCRFYRKHCVSLTSFTALMPGLPAVHSLEEGDFCCLFCSLTIFYTTYSACWVHWSLSDTWSFTPGLCLLLCLPLAFCWDSLLLSLWALDFYRCRLVFLLLCIPGTHTACCLSAFHVSFSFSGDAPLRFLCTLHVPLDSLCLFSLFPLPSLLVSYLPLRSLTALLTLHWSSLRFLHLEFSCRLEVTLTGGLVSPLGPPGPSAGHFLTLEGTTAALFLYWVSLSSCCLDHLHFWEVPALHCIHCV